MAAAPVVAAAMAVVAAAAVEMLAVAVEVVAAGDGMLLAKEPAAAVRHDTTMLTAVSVIAEYTEWVEDF